jgi:hypothetical protein
LSSKKDKKKAVGQPKPTAGENMKTIN